MMRQSASARSGRNGKASLLGRTFKTLLTTLAVAGASGLSVLATPVFHGISAANVTVIQNDTNNNATSVTLVPTLSINDFRVTVAGTSRADYGVQIGPVATNNVVNGILISSITDNGRNNHELGTTSGTRYGTSAIDSNASANPGSSGIWWVPVFGNSTTTNVVSNTNSITYSYVEENFDFAAAWFPYTNYYGGWLCQSTGVNSGVNDRFIGNTNLTFGPVGANVQQEVSGVTIINLTNLNLDARSNAVLICCGGKNEENFADSKVNWADGTWTVTCRDDQSAKAEQDYIAWAVIPLNNTNGVIAGMFAASLNPAIGITAVDELQNAPFTAVHTATGTYHLTIPGASPTQGVLIISGSEDGANNGDNIVSYQANGNGWDITTMDSGDGKAPTLQNFTAVNPNNPAGNLSDTVVSFVYIPAPTAAINVTPTNGLVTSQNGGAATFSVTLESVPSAPVTMSFQASDATAAVLSTGSLTFQPTNYNVPQMVTITGVNNSTPGIENYTINFAPAVSADTNYNNLISPVISVVNIPAGAPGIFLVPATGLITAPGTAATFQAIMNQPPTDNVTVNFTSSDTTHGGTISPASVTFTPDNWSTQQVVAVTGVDDGIVDGNISYQITAAPAVSTDVNYSGYNAGSVSVENLENDIAGVNVSCGTTISVPEGSSTNFTVALSAPPVSNVTITYTSEDTTAGTVSPATLTFTPQNWNVPQTVTLTGVANPANSGNANFVISAAVSSSNFGYSTLVIPDIAAITAKPIGLPSGTTAYGLGMPPIGIDGQATVSPAIDFSGATLAFTIIANADATDVLGIHNDPAGFGIIVSGNSVSYSNNPVATFSGGAGSPLTFTLANGVTAGAVAALIQAVTFSTSTTNDFASRTVQLSLNSGASTVNKIIRVGQLRITHYQDGVDWGYGAYNSETNDEIAVGTANVAMPTGSTTLDGLLVQGGNLSDATLHQVLLSFGDLVGTNAGQIPPGSTIVSADITVNIQKAGDGWAFHRMLMGWDTTYNWNSFAGGIGVDDLDDADSGGQAETNYYSEMGNFITVNTSGSPAATTAGLKLGLANVGVTPDIQAWVNGTTNYGWVCDASAPWGYGDLTVATGFTPGQSATPALRPHLRVLWLPPQLAGASFQDGTNGYTGGHDTEITQASPDNTNNALPVVWSDGADPGQSDITEAFFRFDSIIGTGPNQIPLGAHIESAVLNVACLSSTDCNGNGGQFFPLYQAWDDSSLTWNSWNANGQGILNNGAEAAVTPTATAGTFTVDDDDFIPGGFHSFEVTTDVQNWVNGAPNNGWGVVPWYDSATGLWGADGWGINTSKDPNVSSHPQLVVYYTMTPGYVARPALMPLVVSTSQVLVKFNGVANTTYTVWRTDSLNDVWVNVGTATAGQDGTATFNDSAPLSNGAFYRVSNP